MNDLEPIEIVVKAPDPAAGKESQIDLGEAKSQPVVTKQEVEPVKEPPVPADQGIELLRRQLAEKQREAEEIRRQKTDAERLAQTRQQEIEVFQSRAESSDHAAVVNAIASHEREAEMLEREYAQKLESGEYNHAARIQRQMSQIETRLLQLNQGKEELEYRLYQPVQRQQPVEQPRIEPVRRDPMEERLASLTPASREWVMSHPEVMNDAKLNARMVAAHYQAVADDIRQDTPEYFSYVENQLGYNRQAAPSVQRTAAPTGRAPITSAPVSRSAPSSFSSQPNRMTVTLSVAERETARDMGMSDEEYAENKLYYIQRGDLR